VGDSATLGWGIDYLERIPFDNWPMVMSRMIDQNLFNVTNYGRSAVTIGKGRYDDPSIREE